MAHTKVRKALTKARFDALQPRFRKKMQGKFYHVGSITNPGNAPLALAKGFREWYRCGRWRRIPKQNLPTWGGNVRRGVDQGRKRSRHALITRPASCRDRSPPRIVDASYLRQWVHLRILAMPGDARLRATARAEWRAMPFCSRRCVSGVRVVVKQQLPAVIRGQDIFTTFTSPFCDRGSPQPSS